MITQRVSDVDSKGFIEMEEEEVSMLVSRD